MSNEFVFKKLKDGSLEYVGDFNSVYQNQIDPWSQSADSDDGYKLYYQHSRSKIKNAIAETDAKNVLEVGCGIGYVCDFLIKNLNLKVVGMDISSEAIKIAKKTFPEYTFTVGDIANEDTFPEEKYDVVILNQLLWYVLDSLDLVIRNVYQILEAKGVLIISQAFFKDYQSYGRDILVGCDGLEAYMLQNHGQLFKLEKTEFTDPVTLIHDDGLLVFSKRRI